jgi:hypothetical protein
VKYQGKPLFTINIHLKKDRKVKQVWSRGGYQWEDIILSTYVKSQQILPVQIIFAAKTVKRKKI